MGCCALLSSAIEMPSQRSAAWEYFRWAPIFFLLPALIQSSSQMDAHYWQWGMYFPPSDAAAASSLHTAAASNQVQKFLELYPQLVHNMALYYAGAGDPQTNELKKFLESFNPSLLYLHRSFIEAGITQDVLVEISKWRRHEILDFFSDHFICVDGAKLKAVVVEALAVRLYSHRCLCCCCPNPLPSKRTCPGTEPDELEYD
ncbi:hypothetical protein K438DRAFT_1928108 [Mycena galopus ATCC 62051]|nr:hypothetical protein K438DRAFT_1928108 [Mycena galopus ATCC 62051]